ncbi:MAG TPA: formyltetrahydrofolate deformylase [Polyangiaceae bacterium]|jgi:formyltetrahydrofolate deformylase|nr:formyltetrahydrofolate deformylase [Polyangiaceae bacterium]
MQPPPPSSRRLARRATLLVSCPDRKGLVAELAQVLYRLGANILDADQHADDDAGQFFQRLLFETGETPPLDQLERVLGEAAAALGMTWRLRTTARPTNVAVFVSKYSHCLQDLLWRHQIGELPCAIRAIVSNHRDLEPVAAQFAVPFHFIPVTAETKPSAEAETLALLTSLEIDLAVFARYMQIVSPGFIRRAPAVINIHHSFLPAFVGQKPYHQAHARGVKLIGATAHYVTADLDQGPIIDQDVARISHRDAVEDLIRKGRDLERVVLARAVRLHLEDRVLVYGNKTVVFD